MIDILLAVILISILVFLWINHRILEFNIKDLEGRNGYLHRLIEGLRADNARLLRRMSRAGTYTFNDDEGRTYHDVRGVDIKDKFLLITRESGEVGIPLIDQHGYTLTKNEVKEEPESAKNS